MKIEITPRFRRSVRDLSQPEKAAIEAALRNGGRLLWSPTSASDLVIRHLRRHWFECRVGLETRIVFWAQKGVLTFHVCGNHDHVSRFLKGL